MTEWVLVVFVYAGVRGESVALTHISGFNSQAECMTAGNIIKPMEDSTSKSIKFVCIKRTDSTKG